MTEGVRNVLLLFVIVSSVKCVMLFESGLFVNVYCSLLRLEHDVSPKAPVGDNTRTLRGEMIRSRINPPTWSGWGVTVGREGGAGGGGHWG